MTKSVDSTFGTEPGSSGDWRALPDVAETIIEPRSGWRMIDWRELYDHRDLFVFWVWRTIKARYAQSALGVGWAVLQPLVQMLVFTVIFGNLMAVDSDGAPYAMFSFVALVAWTYFSGSLTQATDSLVANQNMVAKIYFPRMILPLAAVTAKLVDFAIAMVLMVILVLAYGITPTWGVVVLPLLIVIMILTAAGVGMWLTAMAIQFRDVKHAMSFGVSLMMYAAPVVYPVSVIPERFHLLYAVNPMVGVIEGFRSAMLGTRAMPWDMIGIGAAVAAVVAVSGAMYFRRAERIFADVA